MAKYNVVVKDRQTGKQTTVLVEAKSYQEAKQIAMRDYGHSYEVK